MELVRTRTQQQHRAVLSDLHHLRPIQNLKIAGFAALWAGGAWLGGLHWTTLGPGVLLCAFGLLGNAVLLHESAHGLFSRSRRVNLVLGWFCGAPVWVSPTCFRLKHLHHHRHVGTSADTTCLVANSEKLGIPLPAIAVWVLGFGTTFVLPSLAIGGWRLANRRQRLSIACEAVGILLLHGLLFAGLGSEVWLRAWLIPFLLASLAHNVRAVSEHTLTDREDPERNARTTVETGFVAWLHSNAGYHWEHHAFPGVPWYNLPALHQAMSPIREQLQVPTSTGYGRWLRDTVLPYLVEGRT